MADKDGYRMPIPFRSHPAPRLPGQGLEWQQSAAVVSTSPQPPLAALLPLPSLSHFATQFYHAGLWTLTDLPTNTRRAVGSMRRLSGSSALLAATGSPLYQTLHNAYNVAELRKCDPPSRSEALTRQSARV